MNPVKYRLDNAITAACVKLIQIGSPASRIFVELFAQHSVGAMQTSLYYVFLDPQARRGFSDAHFFNFPQNDDNAVVFGHPLDANEELPSQD